MSCQAGVPVARSAFTARLDHLVPLPVIWRECGEPASACYRCWCPHGHEQIRWVCPAHEPREGEVGCRECFQAGREVPLSFARVA